MSAGEVERCSGCGEETPRPAADTLHMKGEDRRPPGGGRVGDGDRGGRGGGVSGVGKRMKEEAGSGRMGGCANYSRWPR